MSSQIDLTDVMRRPLFFFGLSLTVLLTRCALAQNQVQIQFQTDPLVAQTGTEVVFTVLTVSQVLSMTWVYKGQTLGLWAGGSPVINPVDQFLGRITISANQLRIGGAQLRDKGNFTVQVIPTATTGLAPNSKSVQLTVFDAVAGISLLVPTVAVEGRNVSLRCTWTAGTEITVQWGKGGATIIPDARITISGDSLVIKPAQRSDVGEYTCTASNPISAQTATQSVTVYYGPDTPVLTKDTPKDCVGEGDVLLGQTVRLTCISNSLPPALFSWQRDGQPVVTNQPDSGVLRIQTVSSDESGQYVCTARNSITGGTSEQETGLAIVGTCLDGGEVAGIVIGCFLLIILILILFIVLWWRRRRRRRRAEVRYPIPERRPPPPYPQTAGARGRGPQPPLNAPNPDHLYASTHQEHGNPQTLQNGQRNSNTHRQTDHTHTNGLLHSSVRNNSPHLHNGVDNPAFTQTDDQNMNTNVQQQNPNVVIQAGPAQGSAQLPAVHVSLNTPSQSAQQNNGAQMPTIHVNLNSFPTNGNQTQQENSFPFNSASNFNASQAQENVTHTGLSNPRIQNGPSHLSADQFNGHLEAGHSGLIPTGYTHTGTTLQRNVNTQTYLQEPEPRRTSERNSSRQSTPASLTPQQMPWDLLRGTPAYPRETFHQGQASPENSNTTDYTVRPPVRVEQSRSLSQNETNPRSGAPDRNVALSMERQTRSRSADLIPDTRSAREIEVSDHTHRPPPSQQGIRGLITGLIASRHESTQSNSPQTRPRSSQQISAGHSAVSQGHMSQQGLIAPQGSDTRALADPNHLLRTHTAPQHIAVPSQNPAQGQSAQTQPVANGARQPRQGGTAPGPASASQANTSTLTQAALRAHSHRTQTFQSRRQQTQAALLNPGPQTQAPAPAARRPPTPPPVIPLELFQSLPKKHAQHRSPGRGPQPPRPPVNVPVAQRPRRVQQRPNAHQHHGTVPTANQMAHGAGRHGHAHVHGHRPTAGPTHPQQQQAHRRRMR